MPLEAAKRSEGIAELLDYAKASRMPLAIEPLNPMYAADRACTSTREHALDVCDALDPSKSGSVSVPVDVFHVRGDGVIDTQCIRG